MDAIALRLTCPEGLEPALYGSIAPAPCIRAKASAIWLRHEFSTHTNSTRFIVKEIRPASSLPRRRPGLPGRVGGRRGWRRSEEHTSELQSRLHLVCRLLL